MESLTSSPVASAAANGYHLPPMDARAWMVRLVVGVGLALALAMPAAAQTPTPTPAPAGAPKILLAFDASGSMLTDDGAGTRKIDAAKDAAVALLDSLPDSTEIGLRVYGGTLPSRPIGPACRDSKLVMPLGPCGAQQGRARAADPLVPRPRAHPDRVRARAGRDRPRRQRRAHDRAGLRRQGHLPATVAVLGRPARGQGRRRDADPGDRLQRRSRGARGAAVHRLGGWRRLPRRDRRREPARGAAGPLHAGAARVPAQGQGDQGRPRRAPRHAAHPRPVHRPAAARLRGAGTRSSSSAARR